MREAKRKGISLNWGVVGRVKTFNHYSALYWPEITKNTIEQLRSGKRMKQITNLRMMQRLGIFTDRNAKSESLDFRKYNLIYGFNGSGKSTLSRLFASLETSELHPKLPVDCSFDIICNDETQLGYPNKLSGLERRIQVYNSDFIESNLQWNQGKANPVFFIGTDQTKAATELAILEAKIPELTNQHAMNEAEAAHAGKDLGTFKRDRAKTIAQKLHLQGRKYEAPHFANDYQSWAHDISSLNDDELRAAEETLKLADPIPQISPIIFDPTGIGKAFQFVENLCRKTLTNITLEEIQKFPEMLLWLKGGKEFHERHDLEKCLLCGNIFSTARLELLNNTLNTQIDQFMAQLSEAAERLKKIVDELSRLEENGPLPDSISSELRQDFETCWAEFLSKAQQSSQHLEQLAILLDRKRQQPASPVDTSELASQKEVEDTAIQVGDSLKRVNKVINQHNIISSDFLKHRENVATAIRKHFIAEYRDEFASLNVALSDTENAAATARTAVDKAKARVEELRQIVRTHGPAADVINKLVASYLGHGELTIQITEEGYTFQRHGKAIEGMPSEGEKTAISICYFLSKIESDGRKLKDQIIVIDDPISSLDTKALNYACSLIRNRVDGASQVFILTHNQQCLNEFRKAWKNKFIHSDEKNKTAKFFFIDVSIPEGKSKRVSTLVSMTKLLREYDSEYHFLFSHVLKFAEVEHGYSEYGYMMPNVLRRVLDIFLAFKCPGGSGFSSKISEISRQYPDLNRDRLSALDRLVQVESHSDNLDDLISFSTMTLEETRDATDALLKLMHHVDERHTNAMKSICT